MAPVISAIRSNSGLGVLADTNAKSGAAAFRRYNLIYGFNGSGKSTLSRIFSSLQSGAKHPRLPENAKFEILMSDGAVLVCPNKLGGLEKRILVFNGDFIEDNLQWSNGRAKPVFYIGTEQAKFADELATSRAKLPNARGQKTIAEAKLKSAERALTTFRRDRARIVAERLYLRSRKYEAPALGDDYNKLTLSENDVLTDEELLTQSEICRMEAPLAEVNEVALGLEDTPPLLERAVELCAASLAETTLKTLQEHPSMAIWLKEGHAYHSERGLSECVFCTNTIPAGRMDAIRDALNSSIDSALENIDDAVAELADLQDSLRDIEIAHPSTINVSQSTAYSVESQSFLQARRDYVSVIDTVIARLVAKRRDPAVTSKEPFPTAEKRAQVHTTLHGAVKKTE